MKLGAAISAAVARMAQPVASASGDRSLVVIGHGRMGAMLLQIVRRALPPLPASRSNDHDDQYENGQADENPFHFIDMGLNQAPFNTWRRQEPAAIPASPRRYSEVAGPAFGTARQFDNLGDLTGGVLCKNTTRTTRIVRHLRQTGPISGAAIPTLAWRLWLWASWCWACLSSPSSETPEPPLRPSLKRPRAERQSQRLRPQPRPQRKAQRPPLPSNPSPAARNTRAAGPAALLCLTILAACSGPQGRNDPFYPGGSIGGYSVSSDETACVASHPAGLSIRQPIETPERLTFSVRTETPDTARLMVEDRPILALSLDPGAGDWASTTFPDARVFWSAFGQADRVETGDLTVQLADQAGLRDAMARCLTQEAPE